MLAARSPISPGAITTSTPSAPRSIAPEEYAEAIEKLTESRAAYVKAASQAQTRSEADALLMPLQDGRPVDWLFLAMAESKIPAAARRQRLGSNAPRTP